MSEYYIFTRPTDCPEFVSEQVLADEPFFLNGSDVNLRLMAVPAFIKTPHRFYLRNLEVNKGCLSKPCNPQNPTAAPRPVKVTRPGSLPGPIAKVIREKCV